MSRLLINTSDKALVSGGKALAVSGTTRIRIPPERIYAYITTANRWQAASDSYSVAVPVTVGVQYKITMLDTTSSKVGTILRWGFCDYNDVSQTRTLTQVTRSNPQTISTATLTADKKYLIIQVSASYGGTVFTYPYIKLEALSL